MSEVGSGFKIQKYAYGADGNVEYLGEHSSPGQSGDSDGWHITKILYDEFDRVIDRRGPLVGRWTDREDMEW